MLKKIALALMLACGLSHAQTTTTYKMYDDGYVNVPLPFNFNLYGQTFNNSWMYDNGIVSFLQPGTPGAVSPWQWQAPSSLGLSNAKYYIAALWADIAPNAKTVYSTTTDGTYMKYSWNNISEYYSGGTRLSSFSTTIKPDGSVSTSYYSLNLQTSNVLSGVAGDPSKGEIYQTYNAPFGAQITTGTIPNWTYSPYNPCTDNSLSSPTCPGYLDALTKILPQPVVDPTSTQTSATTTTVTTTTTDTTVPNVTNTSTTTPTANTSTTTSVQSSTSTTVQSSTVISGRENTPTQTNGTSIGLNIVAKNQQREQAIVNQAVQNATTTSASAAVASQQEAMSVAAQSQSTSTTFAASANIFMSNGTGLRPGSSSQLGLQIPGMNNDQIQGPATQQLQQSQFAASSFAIIQDTRQIYNSNATSLSNIGTMVDSQTINSTDFLTNRTNPINEVIEAKQPVLQTNVTSQIGSNVNRNVGNNDVAGGVDLTRMATTPNGYNDYLNLTLKDVAFYQPKEVYKNQKNVDNARLLRQLTNDNKHRDMVEEQYRR